MSGKAFTKQLFKIFIVTGLALPGCQAQKQAQSYGILKGNIGVYEGNCMPGPGVPPCEPQPTVTTIYITHPRQDFQKAFVVDSTVSTKEGTYQLKLPAGTYSLFLKDGNEVICDLIQCPDECYCHPFTIVTDSTTIVNANLDHATW